MIINKAMVRELVLFKTIHAAGYSDGFCGVKDKLNDRHLNRVYAMKPLKEAGTL